MNASPTLRFPFLFYKRQNKVVSQHRALQPTRAMQPAERTAATLISLYEQHGARAHNGLPLSHTSHMVQCAMLAMEQLGDLSLILAALLHDIGYLLQQGETANHQHIAVIGAAYLRRQGFSNRICAIVEHQPTAARYLEQIRNAGMTTAERTAFEAQPYFNDILAVCRWHAEAQDSKATLLPVVWFRRLLWDHLSRRTA